VGQVGFHSEKAVVKIKVEKKDNDILNRLERTRQERYPDLAAEREVGAPAAGAAGGRGGRVQGRGARWRAGWPAAWWLSGAGCLVRAECLLAVQSPPPPSSALPFDCHRPPLPCSHPPACPQSYDKHLREQRKAEERRQRAEQKAAKEESKRQQELRSYKGLMRVGGQGALGGLGVQGALKA
jgi:hypothetical protein